MLEASLGKRTVRVPVSDFAPRLCYYSTMLVPAGQEIGLGGQEHRFSVES